MFVAIAAAFIVVGWNLPRGTAVNMGPGYMPLAAAIILGLLGLVCMARGVTHSGTPVEPPVWRPVVLVPCAVLAFGLTLEPLGLVAAIVLTVILGRCAVPHVRFSHTLMLAASLSVLCVSLFYYGFGLPVTLWPSIFA